MAHRGLGLGKIDDRPALDAARLGVAEAENSIPWLRRRNVSCGDCGLSRAIRQTILLVPMSSTATIAERRGDTGFIFGVSPSWRLIHRLPWLGLRRPECFRAAARRRR